ncbi:MAG: hypothetical protein GY930_16060 [bacterium]|nr:hypothetical protein [bacterium]
MKRIAHVLGALLLVSIALPSGPFQQDAKVPSEPVTLRYVPKAKERIQHNWVATHKLAATQVLSQIEGEALRTETVLPTLDTKERRVTTDWIQRAQGGRIQRMRRIWNEAAIWGKLDFHVPEVDPLEVTLKSPLGNPSTSVVYSHVPDEDSYGAYFDQSAMVESLLGGVRLHNTCASLLPSEPVRVGDSWNVELKHLIELLAPTGAMDYRQIKPGGGMLIRTLLMGVGGCAESVWNPSDLKGHLRCKMVRVVGKGELVMAHVELDYKFVTSQDRSAAAEELQMLGESRRGTIVLHNGVRHSGEGAGTLIWNMALNRAHTYRLNGTQLLELEVQTQALHQPAVTQRMTLKGTAEVQYRASVVQSNEFPRPWTRNPRERSVPDTAESKPGKVESGGD